MIRHSHSAANSEHHYLSRFSEEKQRDIDLRQGCPVF
ncbi:hypothetical protein PSPL106493_23865 [Pseudomonas plecoglossicida]